MAMLLKNDVLFLHVPKTGGNWAAAVMRDLGLVEMELGSKHDDIDTAIRRILIYRKVHGLPGADRHLGSFCFVRDPLAWYESWFKYMTQPSRRWRDWGVETSFFRWHPNAVLNDCGSDDFNTFVANVLAKRPGYVSELYSWYTRPYVGFIGRQERLREDLIAALQHYDLPVDAERVRNYPSTNVSPADHPPVAWSPEIKAAAEQLELSGRVRFGYAPSPLATREA